MSGKTVDMPGNGLAIAPRISVIVEWENAILSDEANHPRLLAALAAEAKDLCEPLSLIFLFDPGVVDHGDLDRLVGKYCPMAPTLKTELVPAPGLHYYELKNHGALKAEGETIVFADSDIVPEAGWLAALVSYLDANPELGMVGGFTYLNPAGVFGKAFAAGWFFPVRPRAPVVNEPAQFLWANNCAYRRQVFLSHPFRPAPNGETRGACARQLKEMKSQSVPTANISWALAAHPAPNGLKHIVTRALAEGRDHAVKHLGPKPTFRGFRRIGIKSTLYARRRLGQTVSRIRSGDDRAAMSMSVFEAPICLSVMVAYYGMFMLGAAVTAVAPSWASLRWRL